MTQPPSYPGSGDDRDPNQPPSYGSDQPPSYGSNQPPSYGQPDPSASGQQYGDPSQQYGQPGAYGGYGQPEGQYGQPGQFGQPGQYGAWQGGNDAAKPNDGVSIAAFVLSLTCCLSLVGVVMAFFGLARTKGGQRRGRWAAIAAIPVGLVLTLVAGAVVALGIWGWNQIVTPDNAEVGQCVNIEESDDDDNTIGMMKADCDDSHDAQIVAVTDLSSPEQALSVPMFCQEAMSADLRAAVESEGNLVTRGVMEDPPGEVGDTVVCYVERADGGNLKSKIG